MTLDDAMEARYTDEDLEWIYEAHKRVVVALKNLHDAVWSARHARPRPITWQEIGDILGVTRQGAAERFQGQRKR